MTFNNKKVLRTYVTPHSKNVWGYLEGIGWRKIKETSPDGSTNMFIMLVAARVNNRPVNGEIDGGNKITKLYL